MFSIFIIFSGDRTKQLLTTLFFLRKMELYQEAQKTLIVDTFCDFTPPGFEKIQVPRINGQFCWADAWAAGVNSARNQNIVYLDSDRILPKNYLEKTENLLKHDVFTYTSHHYQALNNFSIQDCDDFFNTPEKMISEKFLGRIAFDYRHAVVLHGPGKNVMSGSTGFKKDTFLKLGGLDRWYCGHGAFADTDFHMHAMKNGCTFVDLGLNELHLEHKKKELSNDLSQDDLKQMSFRNFVYYCIKWDIPFSTIERVGIKNYGFSRSIVEKIHQDFTIK